MPDSNYTLNIRGKQYSIIATPVTVLSVHDGQSMNVYSTGSTEGIIDVSSRTNYYTEFWVAYSSGREQKLCYRSDKVTVREGQMLSLIVDENNNTILAILNHNTLTNHILIDEPASHYGLAKKFNGAGYYYLLLLVAGIGAAIFTYYRIDAAFNSNLYSVLSVLLVLGLFFLIILKISNYDVEVDYNNKRISFEIKEQLLQIANMDIQNYK